MSSPISRIRREADTIARSLSQTSMQAVYTLYHIHCRASVDTDAL